MGTDKRLATVMALAAAIVGFPGAGPAAADPVSLTLRYTCSTRLIGNVSVTVRIDSDIPKSTAVGEPTPRLVVDAAVPVNADATKMLGRIGVKTIEGTVDANASVAAPEGDIAVEFPGRVKAAVPDSGSFHAKATGSAPALTFEQPGRARITVGDLVAHLTPKDASGDVTFPGKIDARCKLDAGQNNVMASFDITGTGTGTGSGTGTTTGTSTSGPTDATDTTDQTGSTDESDTTDTTDTTNTATSGTSEADETASAATAAKPNGSLPGTGSGTNQWLIGGAGALLLAAGAGATYAVRRTRTRPGAEA
ncbi:DUF6801 domain-containing protein [Streptomyces sp. NBC_00878]|uniref:DUF6801 domain-containing protein n=1 Tax=Streptomyces sp. NBC_00878 TaxID=2975854 RepID=UPI0022513096|nr:DUF6801 domain-containing protein [Streptomyces sp. NBC_00878]MCX4906353.1 hypothetical protein [Streptomyces sp. NBC_00878]